MLCLVSWRECLIFSYWFPPSSVKLTQTPPIRFHFSRNFLTNWVILSIFRQTQQKEWKILKKRDKRQYIIFYLQTTLKHRDLYNIEIVASFRYYSGYFL